MTDDITQRLRAAVPKMPDSGTPIAWPCKVRSELLLEAATEIEGLRAALREIARLGALVAHDLQGRVEVGKVMAVQRMANEARAALDASRGNTEEDYD